MRESTQLALILVAIAIMLPILLLLTIIQLALGEHTDITRRYWLRWYWRPWHWRVSRTIVVATHYLHRPYTRYQLGPLAWGRYAS